MDAQDEKNLTAMIAAVYAERLSAKGLSVPYSYESAICRALNNPQFVMPSFNYSEETVWYKDWLLNQAQQHSMER